MMLNLPTEVHCAFLVVNRHTRKARELLQDQFQSPRILFICLKEDQEIIGKDDVRNRGGATGRGLNLPLHLRLLKKGGEFLHCQDKEIWGEGISLTDSIGGRGGMVEISIDSDRICGVHAHTHLANPLAIKAQVMERFT